MTTLKGQNFRVFVSNTTAHSSIAVVAKATNCTINLTNNAESFSTKDDVGSSEMPLVTSKGWNVQVDALNVFDAAAIINAMKNKNTFIVAWDKVSDADNVTPSEDYQIGGNAFISDLTFNFNDREMSAKNVQFQGSGPLADTSYTDVGAAGTSTLTKGQKVRLFLSNDDVDVPSHVIAAAKQLQLHLSWAMENVTTKDTDSDWIIQEPTVLTYDITTSALIESGETITSQVGGYNLAEIQGLYLEGNRYNWLIANVSGANNRTKGAVICSGKCVLTTLNISSQNRQTATYQATLTGYDTITVGAAA